MEYRTYQARTVDEAITQACLALGVTSDRLEYDVTQEPTNGFLGIGSKPAVIRARVRSEQELQKERSLQEAMLSIRRRFGSNAILKGINLKEGATGKERNNQIGGHRS